MDATGLTGKTIKEALEGKGWTEADGVPQVVMVKGIQVFEPGKWSANRAEKRVPVDDIMPAGAVVFVEGELAGTIIHDRGVWLDVDGEKSELRWMLDAETVTMLRIAVPRDDGF